MLAHNPRRLFGFGDQIVAEQPMKPKPLQVALAGAGMISWYHLVGWRNLASACAWSRFAIRTCQGRQARRRIFDPATSIAMPMRCSPPRPIDALDVATPRETHAAWVEAAAERGIDVLCQKPLTPTLAESEALVRRVAGKSRLMAHENWRFRPWYRELKRWID